MRKTWVRLILILPIFLEFLLLFSLLPRLSGVDVVHAESILKTKIYLPDGTHPYGVSVDSINHRAYITSRNPDEIIIFDTQNDTIVGSRAFNFVPAETPPGINIAKKEIYIAEDRSNKVAVLDINTFLLKLEINISGQPVAIAVDEAANLLYVTGDQLISPGLVNVIDLSTYQVLNTQAVPPQPWGTAYNPGTNRLYVSSSMNNSALTVIDTSNNDILATLYFDNGSNNTVAIDTYLNRIYVVNLFDGAVFSVDGNTNTQIAKIQVRNPGYYSYPLGLAVDPVLHKVYTGTSNARSEIMVIDSITNTLSQLLTLEPETSGPSSTFYWLGIDLNLHKVFVPHYSLSYIAVIAEDNTPPNITINSPSGTVSVNSVPIDVAIVDNESGVNSFQYFVDGSEISNTLSSLGLTYLSSGNHIFSVTATDKAGNTRTEASFFTYVPTPNSLESAVNQMYTDGGITKLGSSIYDKLHQAQNYISASDYLSARQTLNALINQIQAQIDVHITAEVGNLLIADINYLLSTFPQ